MTTDRELRQHHEARARSWAGQGSILALVAVTTALPAVPAIGAYLRVEVRDAIVALAPYVVVSTLATFVFHVQGVRRAYEALLLVETWTVTWTVHSLLYASGSAHSIFWIFYFGQVTVLAVGHESKANCLAALAAGPVLLALAFWLDHHALTSAMLSLMVGAIGLLIFEQVRTSSDGLRSKLLSEQALRAELSDLEVERERQRLALPIHDQLQERLKRVRASLQQLAGTDEALRPYVDKLLAHLDNALTELHAATQALEGKQRAWPEVVEALRARLDGLQGSVELHLHDTTGSPQPRVSPRRAVDLERAVLEATRNAVRHANATLIEIRIAADEQLRAEVIDDGAGLAADHLEREEGGLANLRRRAALAGGRFAAESSARGTRVVFAIPAV